MLAVLPRVEWRHTGRENRGTSGPSKTSHYVALAGMRERFKMANAETIVTEHWRQRRAYNLVDTAVRNPVVEPALQPSTTHPKFKHVLFMLLKNFLYWGSCLLTLSLIILAMQALLV